MILTYYENIDLGSASVNISIVSQYHIIYTDLKVHNCILFHINKFHLLNKVMHIKNDNIVVTYMENLKLYSLFHYFKD